MKLFGDVPPEHQEKANHLGNLEGLLAKNTKKWGKSKVAKGYLLLIYDWYSIGMEEEGNRLLKRVHEVCPEYFEKHLRNEMKKDPSFHERMTSLFIEFAFLLTHKPDAILAGKK